MEPRSLTAHDVGVTTEGRGGLINPPTQYAAGPETTTVRYGEGCNSMGRRKRLLSSGPITRDVNGAGARSAVNPHAACDAAGAGNGATDTPTRARRGKPRTRPRRRLRATAPALDPTNCLDCYSLGRDHAPQDIIPCAFQTCRATNRAARSTGMTPGRMSRDDQSLMIVRAVNST